MLYEVITKFEQKKVLMQKACAYMNDKYGAGTVALDLSDTYYNMKSKVPMHIVEAAMQAMEAVGVTPYCAPVITSYSIHYTKLYDRLIAAQNDMRYLPSPRALLESALVHICRPEDSVSLANIEARLDRLEAQLKEGIPAQTPANVITSYSIHYTKLYDADAGQHHAGRTRSFGICRGSCGAFSRAAACENLRPLRGFAGLHRGHHDALS